MRLLLHSLAAGVLLLAGAGFGLAQAPAVPEPARNPELPPSAAPPAGPPASPAEQLEGCVAEMARLHQEEAALQAAPQDDDQKKKIEFLQKQIETLEKLMKLLADQLKKQSPAGVEKVANPGRHAGGALRPGGPARRGTGRRRR